MSETNDPISQIISKIQQHRDEVALKLHLAEMEAKTEFENLENRWKEVEDDFKPLSNAVKDATDEIAGQTKQVAVTALDTVARRLEKDYQTLRSKLDS